MDNMIDCATSMLLAPGIAQVFYGDETGRKLSDARYNVDGDQAFRSDMNWNEIDSTRFSHFKKLGKIRHAHPVIGTGEQRIIDTHTCVRYNEQDKILLRVKPVERQPIDAGGVFADGTKVIELYTGQTAEVVNGTVAFPKYENNVAIIKEYK